MRRDEARAEDRPIRAERERCSESAAVRESTSSDHREFADRVADLGDQRERSRRTADVTTSLELNVGTRLNKLTGDINFLTTEINKLSDAMTNATQRASITRADGARGGASVSLLGISRAVPEATATTGPPEPRRGLPNTSQADRNIHPDLCRVEFKRLSSVHVGRLEDTGADEADAFP